MSKEVKEKLEQEAKVDKAALQKAIEEKKKLIDGNQVVRK